MIHIFTLVLMTKLKTMKSILPFVALFSSTILLSQNYLEVDELTLNRVATKISKSYIKKLPSAHTGFIWNQGDNNTRKWRPQGICGLAAKNKKYLIISWYGRKEANYQNRGVRISLVDITNMDKIKYRHILLVDSNNQTFENLHAGGLVLKNGILHVPDSRSSNNYVIHTFDINKFVQVDPTEYYNYQYILRSNGCYSVPIKPSFMSFDWTKNKIVLGSFNKCKDYHSDKVECVISHQNRIMWYENSLTDVEDNFCSPFLSEMQGVASMNKDSDDQIIWISCSYGRNHESHLHIIEANTSNCKIKDVSFKKNRIIEYPPGLEDLHLAKTSDNLWLLTEFGPHEGNNNRIVFAIKKNKIKP
jgi:hypothetical protein